MIEFNTGIDCAKQLDREDVLAKYRESYFFPSGDDHEPCVYLCGNSLGLQPKSARDAILLEFDDWARYAVDGHFDATHPWYSYHEFLRADAAGVVGALPEEVALMNSLTTNLHLMMVSFYRPTKERFKILVENGPFPSDMYAVRSQAEFHGYNADDAIISLAPRAGEDTIHLDDILELLKTRGHEIALVMIGGVNYYTGQAFDMARMTEAAHAAGCIVGFDLAHAAGNLVLKLHDWNVDFAVWCTYKYLNSGPGSVGGCFVHQRHGSNATLPRFAGWWGNDPDTRFTMPSTFVPHSGADAWQLSNAPVFQMAVHKAALSLFAEIGMPRLREKSETLTSYLQYVVDTKLGDRCTTITPRNVSERGCQLSIRIGQSAKSITENLKQRGVIADYRTPDVVRVAPVPMYNSFEDVYRFVMELSELI